MVNREFKPFFLNYPATKGVDFPQTLGDSSTSLEFYSPEIRMIATRHRRSNTARAVLPVVVRVVVVVGVVIDTPSRFR